MAAVCVDYALRDIPLGFRRFRGHDRPITFAFWGRRGAVSQIAWEFSQLAATSPQSSSTFSLSTANEILHKFSFLHDNLLAVDLFSTAWKSLFTNPNLRILKERLTDRFIADNTRAFVSLMPHIWSPFIVPITRNAGVRHVVIVHDADSHPGDCTALVNTWLLREAAAADHVITLSKAVARRLSTARGIPKEKISVLFHPDLNYGRATGTDKNHDDSLRLLFLGRILPYKGLNLLLDAVESLRAEGLVTKLGVFGEGKINPYDRARLSVLGAEVENRWLHHDEFKFIFSRYDVVVAAHTEASQSGVIAAAFGAGLPVVTTPVAGLTEQVIPDVTGVVATSATSHGLAGAIRKVAKSPTLLAQLRDGVAATREDRSMERFFCKVCEIALG
jgi:glycosyltransferase involved in cell wall biosynthesis